MENSFYYFFSAVPQVLGGVLALFGVFIVFKVQALKSQLIGLGTSIIRRSEKYHGMSLESIEWNKDKILVMIQENIDKSDIDALYGVMYMISGPQINDYRENYLKLHPFLKSLVKKTIRASVYTAAVIIISLSLIPFGRFLVHRENLLSLVFFIMAVATAGSFYLFLKILRLSLDNSKP